MSVVNSTILTVDNLSISFHNSDVTKAVNNISFAIKKGDTVAIVGESGSGKSLTALSLLGLLPQNAHVRGDMIFNSDGSTINLNKLNNKQWQRIRGKDISIVFQEPMSALNPVKSIGKQIEECILIHQEINKETAYSQALNWLNQVQLPEPEKIFKRYPHQLSGGQKQRVMIAMAMCNKPKLLIADEPTTALDVTVQKEIVELMRGLQSRYGMSMIFITHDLSLAANIADTILVMYKGAIIEAGNAQQVLSIPTQTYTKALIACKPKSDNKGKSLPVVDDYFSGNITAKALPAYRGTTQKLLEVNNLRVWFAEEHDIFGRTRSYFKAVDDVTFTLCKGETLGLVGESGCGKSTISRSLVGLLPIHAGEILFNGKDMSAISSAEWNEVRKHIQLIFQDPFASLNPRMTIGEILAEPLRRHNIVKGSGVQTEVERLLSIVHLPKDAVRRYPHQFSGGQRQRIGIARALSVRPQLLICDESVSALDVSVQAQILNLLKELQYELGLSYLFVSHDLSVVYYMSNRVMVMKKGEIVEKGDAKDVLQHPSHPYTRKLIEAMPENI